MTAASDFAKLHRLTPAEAVVYLQGRKQLTKTFDWRDLWHDEHAQQFTVSRLARLDLLKAVQDGITASVKGDLSRRDWTRDLTGLLQKEGWWGKIDVTDPVTGEIKTTTFDPARLKLIYDVNTRQAHSAGRWERFERNKGTHPYIRYITKRDERVRASHRAWDNLTLPVGHAFWDAHYPPNGWRCRCRAMSMTQAEYDAGHTPTGAELVKTAPKEEFKDWTNKRTGEVLKVPVGIDPGFDYNAGKAAARAKALDGVAHDKLASAAKPLVKAYQSEFDLATVAMVDQTAAKAISGQPTWRDSGLSDLREMGSGETAPPLLKAADTAADALATLRAALGIAVGGKLVIKTPLEQVTITDASLPHVVEKRIDARERFAELVEPTLSRPNEVWQVEYDDATTRNRYIKLFSGTKYDLLVMVRVDPDGSVFWNMMQRDRKRMNALRMGRLAYPENGPR